MTSCLYTTENVQSSYICWFVNHSCSSAAVFSTKHNKHFSFNHMIYPDENFLQMQTVMIYITTELSAWDVDKTMTSVNQPPPSCILMILTPHPKWEQLIYSLCSQQEMEHVGYICQRSNYDALTDTNQSAAVRGFDKADVECEYIDAPSETSCLNTSAAGPGLDSDFGASAGTVWFRYSLTSVRLS